MDQKKKMAVAIAAVSAYIQTEEEALCMQAAAAPADQGAPASGTQTASANLWGISGRQSIMQMGTMMQLKVFQRP